MNRKVVWIVGIVIFFFVVMWLLSFLVFCIEFMMVNCCKKLEVDYVWFWFVFLCFCLLVVNLWVYMIRVLEFKNILRRILGRK